jgi:hypothetical protein
VLIAALSLGLVVTMIRHRDELLQLRMAAMRERERAELSRLLAEAYREEAERSATELQAKADQANQAIRGLSRDSELNKARTAEQSLKPVELSSPGSQAPPQP